MKEIEVFRFKGKLEGKKKIFTRVSLLECEWDAMLEKAKLKSNLEKVDTEKSSFGESLSLLSSLKLSAALSTVLLIAVLFSFVFSSSSSMYRNSARERRSVPVINVSSKFI